MSDTEPEAKSRRTSGWWQEWRHQVAQSRFFVVGLIGALVVALLDQASKYWVVNVIQLPERRHIELTAVFDFTYVQNYGASFGLLAGGLPSRVILSVLIVSIVGILIWWLGSVKRKLPALGIALILGGGLGNLVDRAIYGYVVDFIDFSALYFPWVFNLADSSINLGVACLLVDAVIGDKGDSGGSLGTESRRSSNEA